MAANTLSILKPSVNNLTDPDLRPRRRARVRRGRRLGEEVDAGVPGQGPRRTSRRCSRRRGCRGARSGRAARSCSTSATGTASTASTRPTRASGRWSTARCSTSIGTLYPLARARDVPGARLPAVRRRGRDLRGRRRDEGEGAEGRRGGARRARSRSTARSSSTGRQFIGGDTPSIADIRFAASLEFLRAIDYPFPAWAEEYMAAMEEALGEAYSEPAADVRGYIDYVKGQSS